jgi:short-subunit dehydrogenase involved in D-alanine esterification of teichoic acids
MCDCDNIEVVGIRRGDTLVFFVDTDYYDMEDIGKVMESVKEAFPTIKVLMLPDDMIDNIKIFREDDPLVALEMKVANNEINKNLSKIDWTNVELSNLNVGEMGL